MRFLWSFRYLLLIVSITSGFALCEHYWVHEPGTYRSTHTSNPDVMRSIADTYTQLYPNRPRSNYFRGALAAQDKQYDEALSCFQRGVALQGNDEGLLHQYAANLLQVGADVSEFEEAVQTWRRHYPNSPRPEPTLSPR